MPGSPDGGVGSIPRPLYRIFNSCTCRRAACGKARKEVIKIEKSQQIHIRTDRKVKEQLERQAANHNMSLSAYMLYAALRPELATGLSGMQEKKTEQLHTRLSAAAKDKLMEKARLTGISTGSLIEAALRGQQIYVVDLKEMARQTSKLGNNINQLTTLAHEGKITAVNLDTCVRLLEQNLDEMIKIKNLLKGRK